MAVLVRDKVEVNANIFTKSKNVVVNGVMEMLLEIVYKRALPPGYLLSLRKFLEESFYTWLHERTLLVIHLEVFLPGREEAMERWEFVMEYRDEPEEGYHKAPTDKLSRFCETLGRLPAGTEYRLVVQTAPGAKQIPGWTPTTLKTLRPTTEANLGKVGYGNIFGQVFYRGGTV